MPLFRVVRKSEVRIFAMSLPNCWQTGAIICEQKHRLNMELDLQSLFGLLCACNWPPSPRIWAHIRWRWWSAKIDDISLWPPACMWMQLCRSKTCLWKKNDENDQLFILSRLIKISPVLYLPNVALQPSEYRLLVNKYNQQIISYCICKGNAEKKTFSRVVHCEAQLWRIYLISIYSNVT